MLTYTSVYFEDNDYEVEIDDDEIFEYCVENLGAKLQEHFFSAILDYEEAEEILTNLIEAKGKEEIVSILGGILNAEEDAD